MNLNNVLDEDGATGLEVLIALEKIAARLSALREEYPSTFAYLCNEGRMGADFTLSDAVCAVEDAAYHIAEYSE